MIRPFQPFYTISTRRSAPDATGYIIRESLRTVPSSAVRLTADLGLYRCFMDAGGGKTGPGRLFVRRAGRTQEPNVPGRIRSAGSLFLHRNPAPYGSGCRYRTLARRCLSPARGTVFGYRIPGTQVGILFAVRCTLYPESRNPAPYRERMPLPELLPGEFRSGPGHGIRIPIRKTVFVPFYP